MRRFLAPILIVTVVVSTAALSEQRQTEQAAARSNVEKGGALKSRDIEAIVLPKMRGMSYMGFTYFPVENIYRLRFVDGIKAVDVDVDARNGRIIRQAR